RQSVQGNESSFAAIARTGIYAQTFDQLRAIVRATRDSRFVFSFAGWTKHDRDCSASCHLAHRAQVNNLRYTALTARSNGISSKYSVPTRGFCALLLSD